MSTRIVPCLALAGLISLVAATPAAAQDAARGMELFNELECSSCHGEHAQGEMGPAIAGTKKTLAQVRLQVRAPSSRRMPTFEVEDVSDEGVADIYAYLQRLGPPSLAEKRTWWGIDLLNLPTPRTTPEKDFEVHFSHRFSDSIQDSGREGFFGLDSFAFPGFWFSYGFTDRLGAYVGRTANLATYEYGIKFGLLPEGTWSVPLSVAVNLGGIYLDANGIPNASRFTVELPIGYRIGQRLAVQAVPFYATNTDEQGSEDSPDYSIALGLSGSLKINTRLALEGEWITNLGGFVRQRSLDQWQAGVAIEAGRHTFQLMLANSIFTTPDFMAAGTFRTGVKSNIRFGFNLVRSFSF